MMADEAYLISQVLGSLPHDAAAAKSWMIFSKCAFPQSFTVLFQSYKMECEEKNLSESARCLADLLHKFPQDSNLVQELKDIAKALTAEGDPFLKQIFDKLPEEVKYEVMIAVTRNAQTIEEHCELTLLFLKRMPSARLHQQHNIVDTLLNAEERTPHTPLNHFRKMLVTDALPLVLKMTQFDYKFKMVFQLLQKAVEYYVCLLFSPQEHKEGETDEGWKPLLKLIETVAIRYRWNYPDSILSNFTELSLQQLLTHLKRKNKTMASLIGVENKHRREETGGYEEAYFCLVVAYFYYLHHMGRLLRLGYFLVEGITAPQDTTVVSTSDFKRTERGYLVVSKSAPAELTTLLIPAFVTASECFELLHRHPHLMKEFKNLAKNVQMENWPVFQEFYISMLMYERAHRDALEHLEHHEGKERAIQRASCYYALGEFERCLNMLFEVIVKLPTSSSPTTVKTPSKCPARFMHFMGSSNREILQYCVSLLLRLYKSKDSFEDVYRDMSLGYMLILIQYDLEHEYELLHRIIETIQKSKSFCFSKFFTYVINVDILEEMSYLATPSGGGVNLEVLSIPTIQQSRAVTRGVNRGARDDLKQAFVNQMARCYDSLDEIFVQFIKDEGSLLLAPLADVL